MCYPLDKFLMQATIYLHKYVTDTFWHLLAGLKITLSLLDTLAYNPKPTDFCGKVEQYVKPEPAKFSQ